MKYHLRQNNKRKKNEFLEWITLTITGLTFIDIF